MSLLGSALMGALGGAGKAATHIGEFSMQERKEKALKKMEQDFQRSEREAGERFTAGENAANRDHETEINNANIASTERIESNRLTHEEKLKKAELEALAAEGKLDRDNALELQRLQNKGQLDNTVQSGANALAVSENQTDSAETIADGNNSTTLQVAEGNNDTTRAVAEGNNATTRYVTDANNTSSETIAAAGNASAERIAAGNNITSVQVAGIGESGALLRQNNQIAADAETQKRELDNRIQILGIKYDNDKSLLDDAQSHEKKIERTRQNAQQRLLETRIQGETDEANRQRLHEATQNELQRATSLKVVTEQTKGALTLAMTKANAELMVANQMPITVEDLQIGKDQDTGQNVFFYMKDGQPTVLSGIDAASSSKLKIVDIPSGDGFTTTPGVLSADGSSIRRVPIEGEETGGGGGSNQSQQKPSDLALQLLLQQQK